MERTALVTGADGFVGQTLVKELLGAGRRVVGAVRSLPLRLDVLPAELAGRVEWVPFDLEDAQSIRALVGSHPAAEVYHLAALTSVERSWQSGAAALRVNALGTFLLLETLARARTPGRAGDTRRVVVVAGSGEAYGASAQAGNALTEDAPLRPLSPYGASKAAQEIIALQIGRASDLHIVVARAFNHTGPGQRPPFVAPELALRVLRAAKRGKHARVPVGNLEARRDFCDVRDVARAYRLLAERGARDAVYNVCSGAAVSIGDLLRILAEEAGIEVEPVVDPELLRPLDLPELFGSPAAIEAATTWRAQIPLRRTLADLLEDLRSVASSPTEVGR